MSDRPIRTGHPDADTITDPCRCCEGTTLSTLQPTDNRPDLAAIAFRVGDHARFKASMLTNLAYSAYPALADLRTREDDDFSIALIDAWAATCDVLSFYQERLANEAYIGTAVERLSIGELARLTGYRLHPGAAAETDLVILMEDPPAAVPDVTDLTVPAGTRVQSQPGPDETPQVFETLDDLQTRVAWNAIRPRLYRPVLPGNGDSSTWVAGTPSLQVGDALLFVGRERWDADYFDFNVNGLRWDFRRVTAVEAAGDGSRTRVYWAGDLDSVANAGAEPAPGLKLYQLRDRAALFGYNAPHPLTLSEATRDAFGYAASPPANSPSVISGTDEASGDWVFEFPDDFSLHLDAIYKTFIEDSWILLETPNGIQQPYRIEQSRDDTLARYSISGKAQRLTLDTDANRNLLDNDYRVISVYGGSFEIELTEMPLETWVAGKRIELDVLADGLPEKRRLLFRGRRARLRVMAQFITIISDDGAARALVLGDIVTLLDKPKAQGADLAYRVEDETGFVGTAVEAESAFESVAAPDDAEEIARVAILDRVVAIDSRHSGLELEDPLGVAFDRGSLTIHANVARAAHGEGTTEILGGGDPSQPYQKFQLKQAPVTYRLAPTETGIDSTLSVRVDGVEWQETPDLYRRGPNARVFKTALTDDGETIIEFGDGRSGARPPPGRDNLVAEYSRGLGAAGNLRAGQLRLPLDRPLGLKDADNPLPATGGADPESPTAARRNAPIHTLTLGRVVSLTDYRDFALGFPGIAKAEARWVWQGETRRIVVTVAGDNGIVIDEASTTFTNLLDAFRKLGDPLVGVDLLSYRPASFRLGLRVSVDEAYDNDAVLADAEAMLRSAFAFTNRDFGQVVSLSEVAAAAHAVNGLNAVDIDLLYRTTPPQSSWIAYARLVSQTARLGPDNTLLPGEILTLDDGPLAKLELMT